MAAHALLTAKEARTGGHTANGVVGSVDLVKPFNSVQYAAGVTLCKSAIASIALHYDT